MGLGSGPRGSRLVHVAVVTLVLLSTVLAPAPLALQEPVSAVPGISVVVTLDPIQLEATVTQSQLGEANFSGSVVVDQPAPMSSDITISGSVTTGWPIEITPQSFHITGPSTVSFNVRVIVPPATSSLISGNLRVTASVKAPMMSPVSAEVSATVTVGQYHKVRIEVEDNTIEMGRGESRDVQVSIYNDGNGQDTIRVTLVDVPPGVRATLGQSQMTILQDESQPLVIKVDSDGNAKGGDHEMFVRVDCVVADGGEAYWKEYPIRVSVTTLSDDLTATVVVVPIVIVGALLLAFVIIRRRRKGDG